MKKGIIMEQQSKFTIVMDRHGQFHKAIPINQAIGEEVPYEELPNPWVTFISNFNTKSWKVAIMLLILLAIITPFYTWYGSEDTYAYVSLDINPSLELMVNEDMSIQSIIPLNDDAEILLSNMESLEGKSLLLATNKLMQKAQVLSLMNKSNTVLIGVNYFGDKDSGLLITEELDNYFADNQGKPFQIATFDVSDDIRKIAEEQETSMNKIMAEELENSTSMEETTVDNESSTLTEDEKELIQLFYNSKPNEKQEFNNTVHKQNQNKGNNKIKAENTPKNQNNGNGKQAVSAKKNNEKDKDKQSKNKQNKHEDNKEKMKRQQN